jgi:large subunit ribosomal protein L19
MNPILEAVETAYLKKRPSFRVGDVLRVDLKIIEGDNERVQAFEGIVIRKCGHGIASTFTVRKMSFGVGVERTLPLHSPRIESMKVLRSGKVRRAKLFYLRHKSGKEGRIKEQFQEIESGKPAAKAPRAKAAKAEKAPKAEKAKPAKAKKKASA